MVSEIMRWIPFLCVLAVLATPAVRADRTDVMLQYFHWDLPNDGQHWRRLKKDADELARAGITSLWLPPAAKGAFGSDDVGYAPYDVYDLGEFDQKGSVRTKYGTKAEYLAAIRAAHRSGMTVLADAVMNHAGGADALEWGRAIRVDPADRTREIGAEVDAQVWTRFDYRRRGGRYSDFRWRFDHFSGTDWAENLREKESIYLFRRTGRGGWNEEVDRERGNFDYLLLNDVDLSHPEVRRHWADWGRWMIREADVDGFRIDAAKHMQFEFQTEWMRELRAERPGLFAVSEYWSEDPATLKNYLRKTSRLYSIFDFPLQGKFRRAARENGGYDLREFSRGAVIHFDPERSVTFVDNHDTSRQARKRKRFVSEGFKPAAYAFILLRREGFPCVFYPDYFGALRPVLQTLLSVRRTHGHGEQHDFIDDPDVIGWTRAGDRRHGKALAVVLTDRPAFRRGARTAMKRLFVGTSTKKRRIFRERLGESKRTIQVGSDGWGEFPVAAVSETDPTGAVSVWTEE